MVEKDKKLVPYKIVKAPNGDAWVEARGKPMAPSQMAASVLTKMKETAERHLGEKVDEGRHHGPPPTSTTPSAKRPRTPARSRALKSLRIINEPTAAALAYGLDKKNTGTIAVYDLGGGTFDIAIPRDRRRRLRGEVHQRRHFLGGEDFDMRLVDYLADEFKKDQGIDLRKDKLALQRLKEAAEKAKIELSSAVQTEINLPFITADASGPKHLTMKFTRAKLEALVDDLIKKTVEPCKAAMKDAGVTPADIDEVVLVGGMTRMPKRPRDREAVLRQGPAPGRQPRMKSSPSARPFRRRSPRRRQGRPPARRDPPLSPRHRDPWAASSRGSSSATTTIPTKKSQIFSTRRGQPRRGDDPRLQGEREMAADNKMLGQFDLVGLPPSPRGVPQIEVTFDIDANGIVNVQAKDKATSKEQQIRIQASGGLSDGDIQKMVKEAESNKAEDEKRKKLAEAKNHADSLVHNTERQMQEHGAKIGAPEKDAIEKAIAATREAVKGEDADDITAKTQTLAQAAMKLGEAIYKSQASPGGEAGPGAAPGGEGGEAKDENVVDADFTEVDGEKKRGQG